MQILRTRLYEILFRVHAREMYYRVFQRAKDFRERYRMNFRFISTPRIYFLSCLVIFRWDVDGDTDRLMRGTAKVKT